jgi:hypothetical protein
MIADLTRSGMAVQMQFLQGPRPNSGDLQLVKLSGNHRRFSTSKRRGNHP